MKKKTATEQTIRDKINPDDPDTSITFTMTEFPINDLLNSNSFIEHCPDVLDMIFYEPAIIENLKRFNTCSGFVLAINSLKEVKLGNWLSNSLIKKKNTSEDDMDHMLTFLREYTDTQIFNILLKNMDHTNASNQTFDPQEYFDEVSKCCSEIILKNVQPEKVKPQLFQSSVEYSIYSLSESMDRNDVLAHRGINLTFSGNIGIEKSSGGLLKKGKINILIDMSVKVIVYNSYMFSKRGLTCILNGMRDREGKERGRILDEEIDRVRNEVIHGMDGKKKEVLNSHMSFREKMMSKVGNIVQGKLEEKIEKMDSHDTPLEVLELNK